MPLLNPKSSLLICRQSQGSAVPFLGVPGERLALKHLLELLWVKSWQVKLGNKTTYSSLKRQTKVVLSGDKGSEMFSRAFRGTLQRWEENHSHENCLLNRVCSVVSNSKLSSSSSGYFHSDSSPNQIPETGDLGPLHPQRQQPSPRGLQQLTCHLQGDRADSINIC